MKPLKLAAVVSALSFALFSAAPANAVPIEYIFNGTFDGTLGGVALTDQSFSLSFIGSTTSVTDFGEFRNATISNQFTIGATTGSLTGAGNQVFLNPTFDTGIAAVGFGQFQLTSPFFVAEVTTSGSPLTAYNLATAFPLTNGTPNVITQTYFTSVGDLVINSMSAMSFEAVINDRVLPTPIPGALPLFASALGLVSFVAWRRKQKASVFTR
jgi:hypothetical protein